MTPLVSIIIPCYNVERFIGACLDSVLSQDLDSYEIICVDDGSSDDTVEIIKRYMSGNSNIKLIGNQHGGVSAARNSGLDHATGEYIVFVDSDDLLKEHCLMPMISKCKENELDILYYSYENFYDSDELSAIHVKKTGESMRKGVYQEEIIMSGSQMLETFVKNGDYVISVVVCVTSHQYMKDHNIRFIENIIYEDGPFALDLLINARRVSCMNDVCYLRRIREGSIEHHEAGISGYGLHSYLRTCIIMYRMFYGKMYESKVSVACASTVMRRRINSFVTKVVYADPSEYERFLQLCSPEELFLFEGLISERCRQKKDLNEARAKLKEVSKKSIKHKLGSMLRK